MKFDKELRIQQGAVRISGGPENKEKTTTALVQDNLRYIAVGV